MRMLLVILDGLADRPCKELKNKTPLEAAKKPNLDFLARNGKLYLMNVINEKIAPESDQGVLSIFGYDVFKIYTGRGPLEAYGDNVKFENGDVVVRCNFASIKANKIYHNRILDIESMPTEKEIKLVEGIKMKNARFKRTVGHRGVLIINKKISPRVTNSHPGYKIVKNFVTTALPVKNQKLIQKTVFPLENNAIETANIINEFIRKARNSLKNKTILTRGSGNKLPKLKLMEDWAVIADMPVERAIGKLAGMKVIKKPNSLNNIADVIKNESKKRNVYVQIKGPDAFAHKGDAVGKKKAIEEIDSGIIGRIKNMKNTLIVVTADHATPCNLMAHSNDAVPAIVYGAGKGNAREFSEKEARIINRKIYGKQLLDIVIKKHKTF